MINDTYGLLGMLADAGIWMCWRERGMVVCVWGTPGHASIWREVCYHLELLGGHVLSSSNSCDIPTPALTMYGPRRHFPRPHVSESAAICCYTSMIKMVDAFPPTPMHTWVTLHLAPWECHFSHGVDRLGAADIQTAGAKYFSSLYADITVWKSVHKLGLPASAHWQFSGRSIVDCK